AGDVRDGAANVHRAGVGREDGVVVVPLACHEVAKAAPGGLAPVLAAVVADEDAAEGAARVGHRGEDGEKASVQGVEDVDHAAAWDDGELDVTIVGAGERAGGELAGVLDVGGQGIRGGVDGVAGIPPRGGGDGGGTAAGADVGGPVNTVGARAAGAAEGG